MNAKHTASPWYTANTGNHQGLVISEHDGGNVAVAYNGEADANLIAAAPELLDMLRELVKAAYDQVPREEDMEEIWPELYEACGKAERLIAKAEGGQE